MSKQYIAMKATLPDVVFTKEIITVTFNGRHLWTVDATHMDTAPIDDEGWAFFTGTIAEALAAGVLIEVPDE